MRVCVFGSQNQLLNTQQGVCVVISLVGIRKALLSVVRVLYVMMYVNIKCRLTESVFITIFKHVDNSNT